MDDPYEDRSMPADTGNGNYDADDLVDLENMKPPQVDYYAVLNLSKTVRNGHAHFHLTPAAVAWEYGWAFSDRTGQGLMQILNVSMEWYRHRRMISRIRTSD